MSDRKLKLTERQLEYVVVLYEQLGVLLVPPISLKPLSLNEEIDLNDIEVKLNEIKLYLQKCHTRQDDNT